MVLEVVNDHCKSHLMLVKTMLKQRTYSKYAQEAALLLGKQIKLGRKQRKWSEKDLAERAGISRATLQKIENGQLTSAIGLVFEAATLVGVNLFTQDRLHLSQNIEHASDKIALLPQRIQSQKKVVDDDF
jgi:transcriptional regulator with XRE-family HTH domain